MYVRDRALSRFHIFHGDGEALIEIETGAILSAKLLWAARLWPDGFGLRLEMLAANELLPETAAE